jgi:hypothetical protein
MERRGTQRRSGTAAEIAKHVVATLRPQPEAPLSKGKRDSIHNPPHPTLIFRFSTFGCDPQYTSGNVAGGGSQQAGDTSEQRDIVSQRDKPQGRTEPSKLAGDGSGVALAELAAGNARAEAFDKQAGRRRGRVTTNISHCQVMAHIINFKLGPRLCVLQVSS